jgi:hypothetical protein
MSYDLFPAGPISADALDRRLRKYGLREHIPPFDERRDYLRWITDGENYLRIEVDPKGFAYSFPGQAAFFVNCICQEFDTYYMFEQQVYTDDCPEDKQRDRWWQLQNTWRQQDHEEYEKLQSDLPRFASGDKIDYDLGSRLRKKAEIALELVNRRPELLEPGRERELLVEISKSLASCSASELEGLRAP